MLTSVLGQTKVHLWACGSFFASFRNWKWSCIPKMRELRPLHHPTAQRKKTMRITHLLELGRIMGMNNGLWHHQLYYLSALESYYVSVKSQAWPVFASFQVSNLLEGSADGRSPPLPTTMVGLQHRWSKVEWKAKQRCPLPAPPADPVSVTYRHPPLPLVLISSHHSPSLGRKMVAYNFWHCHIMVLYCQQRWDLDVSWQAWGHQIMSFTLFLLQRTQ